MLHEALIWTRDKQARWEKTREKGCLNYVLKVAGVAVLGAMVISLIDSFLTLVGGGEFLLSTVLGIPLLGLISGLIVGRAYWGISESSFRQMNAR